MNPKVSQRFPATLEAENIAVLAVADVFWTHMVSRLGDLVSMRRISTLHELEKSISAADDFGLVLVPHWRWRIPDRALSLWSCIGFHTSPLPAGRGGSPIQNQIARGMYESEVCAFHMVPEMDAGDVYSRRPISLRRGNISEIVERIAILASDMAHEILLRNPPPKPQVGNVTTFSRRSEAESQINLEGLSARQIYDRIRMVDGLDYPPAFQEQRGWILEFTDAKLVGDEVLARVRFKKGLDGGECG